MDSRSIPRRYLRLHPLYVGWYDWGWLRVAAARPEFGQPRRQRRAARLGCDS
jgi:hypothetical protein